jgi:molybdopterin/thiamine biosynthesis adenylyltransferase
MLIDHDDLAAGNLVRHTLSGQDIGKNKAVALADRLLSVAPFSTIKVHARRFPTEKSEVISLLEDRDIVIDCTADDEVVNALSLGWWSLGKLFISASVGYEARRTFLFTHQGQAFPQQVFQAMIEPLLQEERALWSESGETLEGAGCWSPLFPARMDDLLLAASSSIKILEEMAEKYEPGTRLVTFEQIIGDGFCGLKRSDTTGSIECNE